MKKLLLSLVLISFLLFIGCSNVFKNGAKKDTDEAIFEEVHKSVDASDWDAALIGFSSLSAGYKSRQDVIEAWAGAYAGKCGLNFLTYVDNLSAASLTGTTIFKYMMAGFTGTTVYPSYCDLAQTKMEEISPTAANRSSDENYFMAILGMVKIGTYLRSLADINQDGVTDVTYDSCSVASLSDSNLDSIITGMGLVFANISYITAASVAGGLTTLNSACGANCAITDRAAVTAGARTVFRDLLKTGAANPVLPSGIESCVNPLVNQCCP